jgi:hypothetical protein
LNTRHGGGATGSSAADWPSMIKRLLLVVNTFRLGKINEY